MLANTMSAIPLSRVLTLPGVIPPTLVPEAGAARHYLVSVHIRFLELTHNIFGRHNLCRLDFGAPTALFIPAGLCRNTSGTVPAPEDLFGLYWILAWFLGESLFHM
jgi:hypothetical protein